MTRDIQWKYHNNKVICDGYIRGEIKCEDCPEDGEQYYIATIPKGMIVQDIIAFTRDFGKDNAGNPNTTDLILDIGTENCHFCQVQFSNVSDIQPRCSDACGCSITDQEYIVRATTTTPLGTCNGSLIVLIHIIDADNVCCDVQPMELCTTTIILDPCETYDACESGTCCGTSQQTVNCTRQ